MTNLDSSKASGLDSISVVVLKNCEPELSYIRVEQLNKRLKVSFFPDYWKVPLVVPVFKKVFEKGLYIVCTLLSAVWLNLLPNFQQRVGGLGQKKV